MPSSRHSTPWGSAVWWDSDAAPFIAQAADLAVGVSERASSLYRSREFVSPLGRSGDVVKDKGSRRSIEYRWSPVRGGSTPALIQDHRSEAARPPVGRTLWLARLVRIR